MPRRFTKEVFCNPHYSQLRRKKLTNVPFSYLNQHKKAVEQIISYLFWYDVQYLQIYFVLTFTLPLFIFVQLSKCEENVLNLP